MKGKWPKCLTSAEAAALFRVDKKTLTRWAESGKMPADSWFKTPGGSYRFKEDRMRSLLEGQTKEMYKPPAQEASVTYVNNNRGGR